MRFTISDVPQEPFSHYDLMIVALGFETRAAFGATKLSARARRKTAIAFGDRQVLSYEINRERMTKLGFEIAEVADVEVAAYVEREVRAAGSADDEEPGRLSVCVDISSFSRVRLAGILEALEGVARFRPMEVDFIYTPGRFNPPGEEASAITICGPVSPRFAGWASDPLTPVGLVIGLGYEPEKSIGVFEYLEPGECWALKPRSIDPRYDKAVDRANRQLRDVLPADRVLTYPVARLREQYLLLESLTGGLLHRWRPVLVPFGPKTFALCCLLVALQHAPGIAVWRVSAGQLEQAVDRIPDGELVSMRVSMDGGGNSS